MQNPQETADRIKSCAKARGISITKLLTTCELNKNAIFTMQSSGYYPRIEAITKIADYLNVSVDYLLGRTNIPEVNKVNTIVIPIAARGGNGVEYKEMPVEEYLKLLKDYPELTAPQGDIIPLDQD